MAIVTKFTATIKVASLSSLQVSGTQTKMRKNLPRPTKKVANPKPVTQPMTLKPLIKRTSLLKNLLTNLQRAAVAKPAEDANAIVLGANSLVKVSGDQVWIIEGFHADVTAKIEALLPQIKFEEKTFPKP